MVSWFCVEAVYSIAASAIRDSPECHEDGIPMPDIPCSPQRALLSAPNRTGGRRRHCTASQSSEWRWLAASMRQTLRASTDNTDNASTEHTRRAGMCGFVSVVRWVLSMTRSRRCSSTFECPPMTSLFSLVWLRPRSSTPLVATETGDSPYTKTMCGRYALALVRRLRRSWWSDSC